MLGLAACEPPLTDPGRTEVVRLVSSATVDGWRFDHYVNEAYPCSVSGYQTYTIGTRVGSPLTTTQPLWVRMRGGGAGWFDENGVAQPSEANKKQESAAAMRGRLLAEQMDRAGW